MRKFIVMGLMAAGVAVMAGSLKIDVNNHDIAVRPAIPVVNAPAVLAVRVSGAASGMPLTVTAEVDGRKIGEVQLTSGKNEALFDYKPESTGWKKVMVAAKCGKESVTAEKVFPVTARKLHFPWFGSHDNEGKLELCKYPTMVLAKNAGDIAYWKHRGVMAGKWRGAKFNEKQGIAEAIKYYRRGTEGFDGIMIDEIGSYDDFKLRESTAFRGLQEMCAVNEDLFVALWVCGVPTTSTLNLAKGLYRKKGVDLLMLENYVNYLIPDLKSFRPDDTMRFRIDLARRQDVLHSSVITVGIHGNSKVFTMTNDELEEQVRTIKRFAPEMPGMGIYATGKKMTNKPLIFFADSLCEKYFISPVLTLYPKAIRIIDTPVAGKKVKIIGRVFNAGGMDSGAVTVNFYCGNPAYGGKLIGSSKINSVPAFRLESYPKPATVEVQWTPEKRGGTEIFMEIIPENISDTLLDHQQILPVMVR
ncbi:MAG: hypothetical protein E7043_01370 [Lentisphaerae bacterium]|nr:hypothetical protein [Lentisphaerota bacterium]